VSRLRRAETSTAAAKNPRAGYPASAGLCCGAPVPEMASVASADAGTGACLSD